MLFGLTTGHEIALAAMGGAFIVFALASSFLFPSFIKDFPTKKGLRWYLPLSGLFFIAMMASILMFAKEKKEAAAATGPVSTTTTGGGNLTSGPYANGDASAGKTVFTTAGCGACHTLKAAGTTATVGPSLDDLMDDAQHAGQSLGDFTLSAILKPPPAYVPPGFPTNAMPTTFGSSLSKKQIADVIAFVDDSAGGS